MSIKVYECTAYDDMTKCPKHEGNAVFCVLCPKSKVKEDTKD